MRKINMDDLLVKSLNLDYPDTLESLDKITQEIKGSAENLRSLLYFVYEQRLWRHRHKSWVEYCQSEFLWTVDQVEQNMVQYLEFVQELLPQPVDEDTEPDDVQEEESESEEASDQEGAKEPIRPKRKKTVPPKPRQHRSPRPAVDYTGRQVPEHLLPFFKCHDLASAAKVLMKLEQWVSGMTQNAGWIHMANSPLVSHIRSAREWLNSLSPYAVCPECSGFPGLLCPSCRTTGWLTRQQYREKLDADRA